MTQTTLQNLPEPKSPAAEDHIFLSYAREDLAFVEKLVHDLSEIGYPVWVDNLGTDTQGIRIGEFWKQALSNAIHESAVVIIVMSPDSLKSKWVQAEVRHAAKLGKVVAPILLRDVKDLDVRVAFYNVTLGDRTFGDLHYLEIPKFGYEIALQKLTADLKTYIVPKGIMRYCDNLRQTLLEAADENYVDGQAKLLPVNASPYEQSFQQTESQDLLEYLAINEHTIVLGEPGMGKSIALTQLALRLLDAEKPVVPVIVKLMSYDGRSLLRWIRWVLNKRGDVGLQSLDDVEDFLNDKTRRFCILLDGLNEVQPEHRQKIVSEIHQLILALPQLQIVVTSRVQDESWRSLRRAGIIKQALVIQHLTESQIAEYLLHSIGKRDRHYLWRQLDARMRDLASTPLLLWMLTKIWIDSRKTRPATSIQMPDNRGRLYKTIIKQMLERDISQSNRTHIVGSALLKMLETLALEMQTSQKLEITYNESVTLVENEQAIQALLKQGFLVGDDKLRFAPHQTMQEHFAARALLRTIRKQIKGGFASRFARRIGFASTELKYANDPWWIETFVQMAGLTNDEETSALVSAIVTINPWLAWWCVHEGSEVDKKTREMIEKRSIALVNSDNAKERLMAAQAITQMPSTRSLEHLGALSVDDDPEVVQVALPALLRYNEAGLKTLNAHLVRVSPQQRQAWATHVADFDPRPGVGLRSDGLPEVVWCDVPVSDSEIFVVDRRKMRNRNRYSHTSDELLSFQISKYPITYDQYKAFLDDDYRNSRWWVDFPPKVKNADDRKYATDRIHTTNQAIGNLPRDNVSWYQAVAFTRWLTEVYREYAIIDRDEMIMLPSVVQWEYAAGGRNDTHYPWGNKFPPNKANTLETGIDQTIAVGLFPNGASWCDAQDMSGNVWEWTHSQNDVDATQEFDIGYGRLPKYIACGGTYNLNHTYARCGARLSFRAGSFFEDLSFRVIRKRLVRRTR